MNTIKILKTIARHKTFLVSTHVGPDPDALSSQLAIAAYLRALGKQVHCINEGDVPARFRFLPGSARIKSLKSCQVQRVDAAIIVDCGDFDRIGEVKRIASTAKAVINIDHHITNDNFGDLNMVEPHASSTAEVIFDLFKQAKFRLNRQTAILLYLGIMTDTGSFRYANTTARTHEIVSQLLKFKIPIDELYRKLYEAVPLNDLKYFTRVVNTFDSLENGRVVCLDLHRKMVRKFSEEFDLRDKIFGFLRTIKGVEVIVISTEVDRHKTRINLRSQGEVNVAQIAAHFNGGGHRRASGCMISGNLKEAREKILKQIRKAL